MFRPEAFESDFHLARGYKGTTSRDTDVAPLIAPDLGRSRNHYLDYIEHMRNIDEPLWVGLAPRADRLIRFVSYFHTLKSVCSLSLPI